MGTGITLRWQQAPFACEFHLDGGQGLLLLWAGAETIAGETDSLACMADEARSGRSRRSASIAVIPAATCVGSCASG